MHEPQRFEVVLESVTDKDGLGIHKLGQRALDPSDIQYGLVEVPFLHSTEARIEIDDRRPPPGGGGRTCSSRRTDPEPERTVTRASDMPAVV